MALQSHTIDSNPIVLEEFDDVIASGSRFVAQALDIVVVVVELSSGVRGGSSLERDLDVVWPENRQEGVVAEGPVVVQSFVYYVPGVALACPMLGFGGDVGGEGSGEIFFRPGVVVDFAMLVRV